MPAVEVGVEEGLGPAEPVNAGGHIYLTGGDGVGIIVEVKNAVGMVWRPDDDVDPVVLDPHDVTVVGDTDQVAVPPAALLIREEDWLVDLESGVEQQEAALLPVSTAPVEAPVVDDGIAIPVAGGTDTAIADDRHGGGHLLILRASTMVCHMTPPTVRDFYSMQRQGGLASEHISQWLGAVLALAANRRNVSANWLSFANLVTGVGGSAVVVAFAGAVAQGRLPAWPVGLVALLTWHLAYGFDCADGQLARRTGTSSAMGARLDVLCDFAVQIGVVSALAATAAAQATWLPAWVIAVFASTWLVNLFTSVLASGPAATSLITSAGPIVRIVKLIRDHAAVITVCGLILLLRPDLAVWLVLGFAAGNVIFLTLSVLHVLRASPKSNLVV